MIRGSQREKRTPLLGRWLLLSQEVVGAGPAASLQRERCESVEKRKGKKRVSRPRLGDKGVNREHGRKGDLYCLRFADCTPVVRPSTASPPTMPPATAPIGPAARKPRRVRNFLYSVSFKRSLDSEKL